ncbi:hypothetical protein [Streptomyces malaysiensis]|uniref:hypothetical protein n=1 Tax=Streptomyces malaysiensis TaxID=92644 RepID=UPI00142EF387|nr:hypothetical protein [Streptomyces malaysiensis]
MTQPVWKSSQPTTALLSPAALQLLREITRRDTGEGVPFAWETSGYYQLTGTAYRVARRSFFPLAGHVLVTDDGDENAPVRITAAGRTYLAILDGAMTARPLVNSSSITRW